MTQFVPRNWISNKAPGITPDITDKSASVGTGGEHLTDCTTHNIPSVGFVCSYPGANAGKFECEVCLDGIWARRWLSSVEIFNRCRTYLNSVRSVLGAKTNHPACHALLRESRPDFQALALMVWLQSLNVDEIDLKWNEWNQEWRDYVSGWASPEDVICFGLVVCAGNFAMQAGLIRWELFTPLMAVADYLEVISNHRRLISI